MVNFPFITITKRSALVLIMISSIVMVIDSTLVKYVAFSNRELSTSYRVTIFVLFSVLFSLVSMILLKSTKERVTDYKHQSVLKYFRAIFSVSQYLIISILIFIIFQIVFERNYNILALLSSIYVSHISALIFLIFLVIVLIGWFRFHKNYALILYAVSFTLISLTILLSAIYITSQLPYHTSLKKPYSIHLYLVTLPRPELANTFGTALDVLSLLSFMLTWIATAMLLSQYRHRIGRIKFLTLISIPLIYFLFPFETYFSNISHQFILISPVIFAVIYVITFSATKQVGGILFGMVFLTASNFIKRPRLRNSVLATSIGMVIIFGSVEIDSVIYAVYPPFGLVTTSFMPLGSYLLLVGIFTSARRIAEDASLRKDFHKKAENQLDLLKSIGLIEMEKEFLKRYKPVLDRSMILQKEEDHELQQEDVKEIIHDVLQEIQSRQRDITKGDSK